MIIGRFIREASSVPPTPTPTGDAIYGTSTIRPSAGGASSNKSYVLSFLERKNSNDVVTLAVPSISFPSILPSGTYYFGPIYIDNKIYYIALYFYSRIYKLLKMDLSQSIDTWEVTDLIGVPSEITNTTFSNSRMSVINGVVHLFAYKYGNPMTHYTLNLDTATFTLLNENIPTTNSDGLNYTNIYSMVVYNNALYLDFQIDSDTSGKAVSGDIYRYDLSTGTYTYEFKVPLAHRDAPLVTDGEYLYMVGTRRNQPIIEISRWKPNTEAYTLPSRQSTSYTVSAIFEFEGKIYAHPNTNSIYWRYMYDIATDSWSTTTFSVSNAPSGYIAESLFVPVLTNNEIQV